MNRDWVNLITQIEYSHTIKQDLEGTLHCHDGFEVYLFILGNVRYFIEKKAYILKPGDLLVIKNDEFHRYSIYSGNHYEKIAIRFDPAIADFYNPLGFDLLHCFNGRPHGEKNKISLSEAQTKEILKIMYKFEAAELNTLDNPSVLKLAYLLELLVLVNKMFNDAKIEGFEEQVVISKKLTPVLDYISSHLEGDLSLETLGGKFYMNPSYLSYLFKKNTGVNIHEYIIFKRISKAKKLLRSGCSVTEACHLSGFNDYSNFIRTFKSTVGIPPGKYKKRFQ